MRNITTVIFDIGRVLVRLHTRGERFGRLMRAIGIEPDEALSKYWYAAEVRNHMTGDLAPEAFHRTVCDRFGLDLGYDEFRDAWCDIFEPMPGMAELVAETAARYRVGLLSDTDPLHWQHLLAANPWMGGGIVPTLSFEVGCLKPHPAMFETAAANCGCGKDQCLFIDDLTANVDGARYAGMPALRFVSPEKLRRDLAGLRLL